MRRTLSRNTLPGAQWHRKPPTLTHRTFSKAVAVREQRDPKYPDQDQKIDVQALLSKPSWSLTSLLPAKDASTPTVTSKQLHHLLRLSALPPPSSPAEEAQMLETLSSQLRFVQEIQKVDTAGVEPLRSLRDETREGEKDCEIGLDDKVIKNALEGEEIKGKYHKRIRRRRDIEIKKEEEWDPLSTAERKVGRFFVVEGGKEG